MIAAPLRWRRTADPETPTWTAAVGSRIAYVGERPRPGGGRDVVGEVWEDNVLKLVFVNSTGAHRNTVGVMQRRCGRALLAKKLVLTRRSR